MMRKSYIGNLSTQGGGDRMKFNEDKEFERLKLRLNFAIGKSMNQGLQPELIRKAIKECALCLLFNDDNATNFSAEEVKG